MKKLILALVCLFLAGSSQARIITVDDDGLADFNNIQAAIDDSNDGDTIIVQPGSYIENINFLGKNLTLASTKPTDPNVVARTVIDGGASGSVVTFNGTESPECILRGFTITGGRQVNGGGIYGNRTMATIEHNLIIGNTATGGPNWDGKGGGIYACDGIIRNNIIADNLALYKGGGIYALDGIIKNNLIYGNCAEMTGGGGIYSTGNYPSYSSCQTIANCTIVNNTTGIYCTGNDGRGGGVYFSKGNYHIITNCILWGNVANYGPEIALVDYSIDPVEPMVSLTITYSDIQGGQAMVYTHGYCDLILGYGSIDADPCFVDANNRDYHLQSQAGRWDPNSESWVQDDVTSLCIDAGDMSGPIGFEPFPNGGIINMGAYGGTAEASKSYFGQPVCEIIVAGDINGDCKVNFLDFRLMAFHWLEDNTPVNSNSIVDVGIQYYVQTDKIVYHLGESVEMMFRITNLTDEDVLIGCSQSPEFNLWIQKDGETIWMKVHGWYQFSPGIWLSRAESKKISYSWDMRDDNGNLIDAGIYDVVGVMYNEPWNYVNHGSPTITEVAVPITIIP